MLVSRLIPPAPHCSFGTNSFSLNTNTGSLSLLGLKIAIDCMLVKALLAVAKWDVKDVCYKKPIEQECFTHKAAFPDRGDFTANLLLLALVLGINLEENSHGETLIGFAMSLREVKARKTSMQSNIESFPASSGLFGIHGQCPKLAKFNLN